MSALETDEKNTLPSPQAPADPAAPAAAAPAAAAPAASTPEGAGHAGAPQSGATSRPKGRLRFRRETRCTLCREKVTRMDYKDITRLQSFCRTRGRIQPRRRTGNCARHQRMVKIAIKQARFLALLSYTDGDYHAGRQGRSW